MPGAPLVYGQMTIARDRHDRRGGLPDDPVADPSVGLADDPVADPPVGLAGDPVAGPPGDLPGGPVAGQHGGLLADLPAGRRLALKRCSGPGLRPWA